MPTWLAITQGPIFRFTLAVLVLGLLRLVLLITWQIIVAIRRAGDRRLPYRQIIRQTLTWLVPVNRLHRSRAGYSLASFTFHLGFLLAGFFLINHLDILQANIGFSWLAIPKPILDSLTLLAIVGGSYLLLFRLYVASSRNLSRLPDYLLLILILSIIASGYLAGRPWNPIPYNNLMLFHSLAGITFLLLVPFTKIAHCVLFPLIRLGSEIAWRMVPQGGEKVIETLYGPQGRKI